MRRLLLTVEDTFLLRRLDTLVLTPSLVDLNFSRPLKQPIDALWPDYPRAPSPRPTQVELRLPDGTTRTVACRFGDMYINYIDRRSDKPPGFKPPWVVTCGFPSFSREDVPPGTEVWYESDD